MSVHCVSCCLLPPKRRHTDLSILHIHSPTTEPRNPSASTPPVPHPLRQHGNQLCSCVTIRAKSGQPRLGASFESSGGCLPSLTSMLRLWSRRHCATPNLLVRKVGRRHPRTCGSVVQTQVGSEPCGGTHRDGPRTSLSSPDAPPVTSNSAGLQRNRAAKSTTLKIRDIQNLRNQLVMLLGDRCQSRPNIGWMSQRRAQHSHTLLFGAKQSPLGQTFELHCPSIQIN